MGCDCINSSLLSFYLLYFKDRHYLACTNSEDPDQVTGRYLIRVFTVCKRLFYGTTYIKR